jgi:hypothetical protein
MTRAKHALSRVEGTRRRQGHEQLNSKHEVRNSKQIQMIKNQFSNKLHSDLVFRIFFICDLFDCKVVSDFDIRISNFVLLLSWHD